MQAGSAPLSFDINNAFISVDRSAMLAAKERLCTKFLPNAKFYYGASTPLLCDGFVISSYRGSAADTGEGWVHSYRDDDLRVVLLPALILCLGRACPGAGRSNRSSPQSKHVPRTGARVIRIRPLS